MSNWVVFAMGVGAVLLPILLGALMIWLDSEVDDG